MSLPSGYIELAWIQSSGSQCIDSGFKANQDTRVVCKGQFLNFAQNTALFGHRYSTSLQRYEFFANTASTWYSPYNASAGSYSAANTNVIVVDKNKNETFIDGVIFDTQTYGAFQCSGNLFLLACNSKGSVGISGSVRMYSCQIYDNGTLVKSFVPCKNASGEVGMWDDVNGVFHSNAGTGDFVAGPEVLPEPPAGPTELSQVLTVGLRWSMVDGATGYRVYRDGSLVGETEHTAFADYDVDSGQTLIYTVTAYNAGGESAGTSIEVYTKTGYFIYQPYVENATFR